MISPSLPKPLLWGGGGLLAAGLALAAVAARGEGEQVVSMTAMKFEFTPETVTLKKGVPVILELTSLDRTHGFTIPELKLRADILPDQTVRVRIVPEKVGRYGFHCDNFCGDGHEDMSGTIVVTE
ncbi:MAG TPA: cupredoxin domain-containing protein [Stellaceae bacterium]|nr:cupredoxin domain-containing protein [Stellaceae bacterium]